MRKYTAEEFGALNLDVPCELVRGVLEVREHPHPAHAYTAGQITVAIGIYLKTNPIGVVMADTGYTTERGPDTVRAPDVSFMSFDRLPPDWDKRYSEIAADLAVEVLSESNTRKEIERKITEYFTKGARLVWVADPAKRTVAVHAPDAVPYIVGRLEILDGGDVLPGFRVAVNTFFGWPPRSVSRDTVPSHDLE